MRRISGIVFGAGTQALFLVTVVRLFQFLHADDLQAPAGDWRVDLGLAVAFAAPHSLLLAPSVRRLLTRWIPSPFYGCFFCVATCLSLWAVFLGWRSAEPVVWRLDGVSRAVVEAGFVSSWIGLFYSLYLSGLGYQTGLTPWWHWLRRRPEPRREFRVVGLYRWLRHPIYLSFLGLIWFQPVMTSDRLLLAVVWTIYIFLGSVWKDERLAFYLGDVYRAYQQRTPGYPGMPFGPLARRSPAPCNKAASMVRPGPNASATQGPSAA